MLADPGLVIVQPVQVNQKLHVAIESEQRVFVQRMKGSEKNPCLQKPVVHRPRSFFQFSATIVAITGRLTRQAGGRHLARATTLRSRKDKRAMLDFFERWQWMSNIIH